MSRLDPSDLPACLDLAADRGWTREDHKWRLLFEVGEVYGITDPDGRLVGTTVLTGHGTGLCAISMVVVSSRYDGQGMGKRLMSEVMARTGDAIVTLYATSLGRRLYEKLGFVAVSDDVTHIGRFDGAHDAEVSCRATEADVPAIVRLDTDVHGVDRSELVGRLPSFCSQLRVIEGDGRITGYAGAWNNADEVVVWPIVASGADDAKALITDLSRAITAPIRLGVLRDFGELGDRAAAHGLAPSNTTSLMVLNGRTLPGDAARRVSPVSFALG